MADVIYLECISACYWLSARNAVQGVLYATTIHRRIPKSREFLTNLICGFSVKCIRRFR